MSIICRFSLIVAVSSMSTGDRQVVNIGQHLFNVVKERPLTYLLIIMKNLPLVSLEIFNVGLGGSFFILGLEIWCLGGSGRGAGCRGAGVRMIWWWVTCPGWVPGRPCGVGVKVGVTWPLLLKVQVGAAPPGLF